MFRPGRSFRCLSLAATLALAGLLASPAPAWAADGFLSVADDVPLMPGLAEAADTATVFDKPAGRIASTEASGKVAATAVRRFYAETLPQLGWAPAGPELYRRDSEQLRLTFAGRDGALTVRFELLPNQ